MAPAFLDAMVCSAAAPAEVALWEGILRDSFNALRGFSFLDADKAEGPMRRWAAGWQACGTIAQWQAAVAAALPCAL